MSSDRQIIGLFSVTELNGETLGIAFFAHVQDPSGQKQWQMLMDWRNILSSEHL